jgi:hypothetical protein
MEQSQMSFWGAVVQIIPVLLLALVVEARGLKHADNAALRIHLRRLRVRHGTRRLRDRLRVAWAMTLKVAVTGFMPAYMMLITALLLVLAEFVGLLALLAGTPVPPSMILVAIAAVIFGVITVAVTPVVVRFAEAWRETDPDQVLSPRKRNAAPVKPATSAAEHESPIEGATPGEA